MQSNTRGAEQHADNRSSAENLNVNLLAQKSLITQKEVILLNQHFFLIHAKLIRFYVHFSDNGKYIC